MLGSVGFWGPVWGYRGRVDLDVGFYGGFWVPPGCYRGAVGDIGLQFGVLWGLLGLAGCYRAHKDCGIGVYGGLWGQSACYRGCMVLDIGFYGAFGVLLGAMGGLWGL